MNNDKNELIRAKIMAVPVSKMGKVNSAFYMRKYCAELAEARERELLTEIERLSKPYVPMTRDEWEKLMDSYSDEHNTPWRKYIETAVIKRLGLEIKHD